MDIIDTDKHLVSSRPLTEADLEMCRIEAAATTSQNRPNEGGIRGRVASGEEGKVHKLITKIDDIKTSLKECKAAYKETRELYMPTNKGKQRAGGEASGQ
jgi:hypothetical protein